MKQHIHNWQFIKEVYVDEWDKLTSSGKLERGYYGKFVCHCGLVKSIKLKEKK